ncbi:MAG: hypothetical protein WBQ45_15890 [Roseiarcus sp.]
MPEYPIFSPISSQEGTRVAINPEHVSSLVETGPKRVIINLSEGGAVSVAMSLDQVMAHLRGAQLAVE